MRSDYPLDKRVVSPLGKRHQPPKPLTQTASPEWDEAYQKQKMPHYYTDFVNPPPFGISLPGAVGYLSKGGLEIIYGKKPPAFEARLKCSLQIELQRAPAPKLKQPDGSHCYPPYNSKTSGVTRKREFLKPKSFSVPKDAPKICEICDAEKPITRHHVTPRHIRKTRSVPSRGVRYVCRPCHTEIHKLFSHEELVALDWDQVVLFMRNVA